MSTPLRYILLQLPGLAFLVTVLWWAHHLGYLPFGVAIGIATAWVIKDVAMYPLTRRVLAPGSTPGVRGLHGRRGRVLRTLNPEGLILIGHERWLARSAGEQTLQAGLIVTVIGSDGMQLIVTDDPDPAQAD